MKMAEVAGSRWTIRGGSSNEGMRMQADFGRKIELSSGDALLLVNVQNDFLGGGAVPVPGAEAVIPLMNDYLARFASESLPVFAIRDWHPLNHCSFQSRGGPLPTHCVAGTNGAEPPPGLTLPPWTVVIPKATTPGKEASSGFDGTDLEARLRGSGLRRLFVAGYATDFGVLATVKDALSRGFQVCLLTDAVQAMKASPEDGKAATREMVLKGAIPVRIGHGEIERI